MIEHHAHIFEHGRALSMVDLAPCTSAEEALERLADRARSADGPVLAHGARPEGWAEPKWPGREAIDAAVGSRVCIAWCFDSHALVASTEALRAAGVGEETSDPDGGVFERDAEGALTGLCLERAALRVWDALPEPNAEERRETVRAALEDLARHGFGAVHDLKAQPWLGDTLADLEREGTLPCDVVLWPLAEHLTAVHAGRARWLGDRVRLGGGKIFVDGTLNSRTAWVTEPFADGREDLPHGMAMLSVEQIDDAVRTCDGLGLPMAAHAIGDAAVRAVLDSIERVGPETAGFRIEHAELVHEDDVPRFASLGVACSVQPCHLLYDIEALRRATPGRLARVLPLRDLIDSGCGPGELLLFGSDTPIVRPDPGDSVRAAVHRRRAGTDEPEAIAMEQAITEAEAWAAFGRTALG